MGWSVMIDAIDGFHLNVKTRYMLNGLSRSVIHRDSSLTATAETRAKGLVLPPSKFKLPDRLRQPLGEIES
jgi:hypothetical protein